MTAFFKSGTTYQRRRWLFQCLAVAPNPFNGETRAVGFLYRPGEPATATALDPDDWEYGGWAPVAAESAHPCPECRTPVPAGTTYCSPRCRNAADRHEQNGGDA